MWRCTFTTWRVMVKIILFYVYEIHICALVRKRSYGIISFMQLHQAPFDGPHIKASLACEAYHTQPALHRNLGLNKQPIWSPISNPNMPIQAHHTQLPKYKLTSPLFVKWIIIYIIRNKYINNNCMSIHPIIIVCLYMYKKQIWYIWWKAT